MRFGNRKSKDGGRGRAIALASLLIMALAASWTAGCADNPNTTILEPPGGQGGVIGKIVFSGLSGDLPQARITPTISGVSACSGFGAIAVLGTLNGFSTAEAPNYAMRQIASCEWLIELDLEEGPLDIKFVTGSDINSVAFDSPGDYGVGAANNNDDPLEGTLDNPANGPDGNLSVTIPTTGLWTISLNENTDPATYKLTQEILIPLSDPVDGTFEIIGLPVGRIGFVIEAEGFSPVTITNVDIEKNKVTDLGEITMDPIAGALTGTIGFADNPSPPPLALVEVRSAATLSLVDTVSTTGAFSIEGLATGSYLLWIKAEGYDNLRVYGVDYVNGQNTDVGTKTLAVGCSSEFLTIQLAGEFTSWTLGDLETMTEGPGCLWIDTVQVEPGNYNFKFVTGGVFDGDYGGDETTLNLPGTYPVIADVSGEGTALNVEVAVSGEYIFTLDEENLEFTASFVGDIPSGSVEGTVSFADVLTPPLPEATVQLLRAGTTNEVDSQLSDRVTGAFGFEEVPEGTYDVKVTMAGYLPQTFTDLVVTADQITDVGSVVMQVAVTSLHGSVAFSDAPSPLPEATVEVRNAATDALVDSKVTTGDYTIEGLATGDYFLWIRADGYQNARVLNVDYVSGVDYDAGTVTLDPGCASEFLSIQLAGELTSWNLTEAPVMVEGPGCVWTDTLDATAGTYIMKFVTERTFDNPRDYGGDESSLTLPGTFPVDPNASGEGSALVVVLPADGRWVFTLNEEVPEFTGTLLGAQIDGAITGQVAFAGISAAPFPEATVSLFASGGTTPLRTGTTDTDTGTFTFTTVADGTYDLSFGASCFSTETVTGVTVAANTQDVGTVNLSEGGSSFTSIQIAGEFTSWDLGQAPSMTQGAACTWVDTLTVAPGTYNFKFVTDGAFDNDYGSDETELTLPGTYAVVAGVRGEGTAVRVTVTEETAFIFTLNERTQEFSAVAESAAPGPRSR